MKLSILVLTVPSRIDFFYPRLMKSLVAQTLKYPNVEILALFDNKKRTVGEKRQNLIDLAKGEYLVFIDDDDRITSDYVEEIMNALTLNPLTDCVVFDFFTTINGDQGRKVRFGIEYENFTREGDELRGKPAHTCVYKSEIAKRHRYTSRNHGEDIDWIDRACKDIKVQTRIEKILYYYDANYTTTSEVNGLSDETIRRNVQLKLDADARNAK